MPLSPPPSPPPTFAPCPTPVTGLVAIAVDPAQTLAVKSAQSFVIALRSVGDAGYAWRLRPLAGTVARFERRFTIADVAYANADRPTPGPSARPMPLAVGGASTEYFAFTVQGIGDATLVFDLFGPGGATPTKTSTFHVSASANIVVC